MEEVECAECGNRYDSAQHAFCPRCGNVGRRGIDLPALRPAAVHPARRRAQAGGLVLVVLGSMAALMFGYLAAFPPALDDAGLAALREVDFLAQQPGGDLHVRILQDGIPWSGDLTVQPAGRQAFNVSAGPDGWVNLTRLPSAFGNLSFEDVAVGYYVPEGARVTADIDRSSAPAWVAVQELTAVRVIAGFLAAFGAFVVLGGVMAMRLRAWPVALAAAIIAVAPGLLWLVLAPVAGIVLLLPPALALAMIVIGRGAFR